MAENAIYKSALTKAMAYCSHREVCIYDIQNKLSSWGATGNDSDKIIDTLLTEKFIDENRYAKAFVRDKFNYNKWGKVKISIHLKRKNIESHIIKTALDSIDNEVYIKSIKNIIEGHKKFVKAKNAYDLKAKLLRYGLSKGFESNILYDLLDENEW